MPSTTFDQARAETFARIALGHVTREFPHKLDHVMTGPADAGTPRDLHPVFFGSFDWHSCVHGYWTLARLLRRFPAMAPGEEIRRLFDTQLTSANVSAECAYLERPAARGFERPYGWAWLLKLAAELHGHADGPWATALTPLAAAFAERFRQFLPVAAYPIRTGSHGSTAFALALAADYATAVSDAPLLTLLRGTAERWYAADAACQAWEPGGDDFLSPALVEAECMRRLLPPAAFRAWFDRFLPGLARGRPAALFRPAMVSDRTDGKLAHLDGLNFSRAWCWRALARALPDDDPRRAHMESAAETHLAAALPHLADDYMGEHWLTTFALLALDS